MLEFGQDISFVALVIIRMISDLHLGGKPMLRPVQATWPKYPQRLFFFCNYVKNCDVTLQFGRDISFVALVMIEKV